MSHTTEQAAAALKAAGFPQPGPDTRQLWYNDAGTPYYVTAANGWRCDYVAGETLFIDRYLNGGEVFAPTAEDILAALGEGWSLSPVKTEGKTSWYVTFMEDGFVRSHQWHETAAEACAAAYLNLYAPK